MKKFIVAILTFLYIASTSGATVHFHYCMGKLVNTGLTHDDKDKCGKCGMEKKKSSNACCKDTHKFVKVEQSHKKAVFAYQPLAIPVVYPEYGVAYPTFTLQEQIAPQPIHGPPPAVNGTPLFVRYCNFRI